MRIIGLAVLAATVTACSFGRVTGYPVTELEIHVRSESASDHLVEVQQQGTPEWSILVPQPPEGGWAEPVTRPVCGTGEGAWRMTLITLGGESGATRESVELLTAADFPRDVVRWPRAVRLWIDIAADGGVTAGQGRPAWPAERGGCGPFASISRQRVGIELIPLASPRVERAQRIADVPEARPSTPLDP